MRFRLARARVLSGMLDLTTLLRTHSLTPVRMASLKTGDTFIAPGGFESIRVVAASYEQGSGPRPSTASLALSGGAIVVVNAEEQPQQMVTRITPRT